MELLKYSIKNLRVSQDPSETRLIKFRRSSPLSEYEVPLSLFSAVNTGDGFNICLSPNIKPNKCKEATPSVGLYIRDIVSNDSWRVVDTNTEDTLVQGEISSQYQDGAVWSIIDEINGADLGLRAKYIYDDGSPFSIENTTEDDFTLRFELLSDSESSSIISQYYSEWSNVKENPSFEEITQIAVDFCLSPNPDRCINSLPYTVNVDKTLVKVPSDSSVILYIKDKEFGDINAVHSYPSLELANGGKAFKVFDLNLPTGLRLEVDSQLPYDVDSCSLYSFQGIFYVDQRVVTWYDSSRIASFYIEKNGVKTYLENSSMSFQHGGSSSHLKALLAPYYQRVESFLRSHGVDATYGPDIRGSYNTGGLLIKLTQDQKDYINIGTEYSTDYDLYLEGYFDSTCVQYKTFEELENAPSTLTFVPATSGPDAKSTYTILANHVPDNPEEINILSLLGIAEDIEIQTCFGVAPS